MCTVCYIYWGTRRVIVGDDSIHHRKIASNIFWFPDPAFPRSFLKTKTLTRLCKRQNYLSLVMNFFCFGHVRSWNIEQVSLVRYYDPACDPLTGVECRANSVVKISVRSWWIILMFWSAEMFFGWSHFYHMPLCVWFPTGF